MKIYDCFTFFNELDLLELRLSELDDSVDYFVLVESNQTHARTSKKLFYRENKERFKKWNHKIIHVVMDMPKFTLLDKWIIKKQLTKPSKLIGDLALSYGLGRMKMDWAQRKAIRQGLKNAKDEDLIIISDLDEIIRKEALKKAIPLAKDGKSIGFEQQGYSYYVNGKLETKAISSKMCSYKTFKKKYHNNPQNIRIPPFSRRFKNKLLGKKGYHGNIWNADLTVVKNAGWHFTFLGGVEAVKTKIKNYPHVENFSVKRDLDDEKIKRDIEKGKSWIRDVKYVKLDKTFPKTILENKKKYAHLIKKV